VQRSAATDINSRTVLAVVEVVRESVAEWWGSAPIRVISGRESTTRGDESAFGRIRPNEEALTEELAGQVDLVYIDPPFDSR